MPDPLSVWHKSHIPKIMFLTALARPHLDRNFDGRVGIWRICEEKLCDCYSLSPRGEFYIRDCTLDVD